MSPCEEDRAAGGAGQLGGASMVVGHRLEIAVALGVVLALGLDQPEEIQSAGGIIRPGRLDVVLNGRQRLRGEAELLRAAGARAPADAPAWPAGPPA